MWGTPSLGRQYDTSVCWSGDLSETPLLDSGGRVSVHCLGRTFPEDVGGDRRTDVGVLYRLGVGGTVRQRPKDWVLV